MKISINHLETRNKKACSREQAFLISYLNKWCPEAESNHRHGDFQSPALPTELSGHPG